MRPSVASPLKGNVNGSPWSTDTGSYDRHQGWHSHRISLSSWMRLLGLSKYCVRRAGAVEACSLVLLTPSRVFPGGSLSHLLTALQLPAQAVATSKMY
ncbi:hypothetical protein HispidOSU_023271, partial [Sigmodon hispidus]